MDSNKCKTFERFKSLSPAALVIDVEIELWGENNSDFYDMPSRGVWKLKDEMLRFCFSFLFWFNSTGEKQPF